ncbi:calcineurin-like phosphoesterase C-terminal domain-containing protein [Mariniblastus fucicola]|uniref:calcineurin-like phosphoesterase C-terminal domain-containing protein n=1 Tax=Mariniblastus fucicola TaxID=980251 RepID=UPI0021BBBF2C|nr:calcineurin-like phosphoesterase C-terminal domain-containing protein [Mariniblastus fucicola]
MFSTQSNFKTPSEFWVNVYNGSSKSKVECAVDGSTDWQIIEQKEAPDPNFTRMYKLESQVQPPIEPKLTSPKKSMHLWHGTLPTDLEPGTHLLRVRATDMHGRVFYGQRTFRVAN